MLILYPISHGKHNNIHYIAKDKKGIVLFKIVCFLITKEAYIIKSSIKFNIDLLNIDGIYNCLLSLLNDKGFKLKTPKNKLFNRFQNTSEIISYYNLFDYEP